MKMIAFFLIYGFVSHINEFSLSNFIDHLQSLVSFKLYLDILRLNMGGRKTYVTFNATYAFILLTLLIAGSHGDVDTTNVGVEIGDIFTYKLTDFKDEFDGITKTCVKCDQPESEQIFASQGDEWSIEIQDFNETHIDTLIKVGNEEGQSFLPLGERTKTSILYTDWDYWPSIYAEDWAWVLEAKANPTDFYDFDPNVIDFEGNLKHEIDGDVFATILYWKVIWNNNSDLKTWENNQVINFDIETGAWNDFLLNATKVYWDGTEENRIQKHVLQDFTRLVDSESTTSSGSDGTKSNEDDSSLYLIWILAPISFIIFIKRRLINQ
jgi:hypothetical protein